MESNTKLYSSNLEDQRISDFHGEDREIILSELEVDGKDKELFIRHAFATDPQLGVELLYRHYFQPLCSHAVRLLYSKTIAEDLVSDIFLHLYTNGTYKEIKTSYRAYLYKTVRNRALNYKRDECKNYSEISQCAKFADTYHQRPDSLVEYEELLHHLEAGINSLPTQRRRIFVMHRFENKKYTEIAEELQLSARTVEVQIRKASHFLRGLLTKYWLMMAFLSIF